MNIEKFKKVIQDHEQTHDEWQYGVEQCWKKEVEILTEDIPSTIEFLKNDCSANEYSWISEVLDEIVMNSQNYEILKIYKGLMNKFPDECIKYNIEECVKNAEKILEWEDECEKKD